MSDEADRAEEQEEAMRQAAIRTRKAEGPVYTGVCANCGYDGEFPKRGCDADCREDWQKRARCFDLNKR